MKLSQPLQKSQIKEDLLVAEFRHLREQHRDDCDDCDDYLGKFTVNILGDDGFDDGWQNLGDRSIEIWHSIAVKRGEV